MSEKRSEVKSSVEEGSSIEALRKESASHRVAKSEAQKKVHVLETVLKRHNIGFDVSSVDLNNFKIDNGKVVGDFKYTPPQVQHVKVDTSVGKASAKALTIEDVKNMSTSEINKRWEEVSKVIGG